jgi:hypothetical protein
VRWNSRNHHHGSRFQQEHGCSVPEVLSCLWPQTCNACPAACRHKQCMLVPNTRCLSQTRDACHKRAMLWPNSAPWASWSCGGGGTPPGCSCRPSGGSRSPVGTTQHSTAQHDTAGHRAAQYGTEQVSDEARAARAAVDHQVMPVNNCRVPTVVSKNWPRLRRMQDMACDKSFPAPASPRTAATGNAACAAAAPGAAASRLSRHQPPGLPQKPLLTALLLLLLLRLLCLLQSLAAVPGYELSLLQECHAS